MSEAEPHENPLVPNRKLRQIYAAMVGARLLAEHLAQKKNKAKARSKRASTEGEEACRISTSIDLAAGDLISDCRADQLMGLVAELFSGVPVKTLLRSLDKKMARSNDGGTSRLLPWIEDASERLALALGVALAFKAHNRTHAVAAYVRRREIGKGDWRRFLTLASTLELPIFFVVLPDVLREDAKRKKAGKTRLPQLARSCNVPGITVDVHDAVALYRVTQETLGRIRGGGGPVLIECVAYVLEGTRVRTDTDPILEMKRILLEKKAASQAWLKASGAPMRRNSAVSES